MIKSSNNYTVQTNNHIPLKPPAPKNTYNLEQRVKDFAKFIVRTLKTIPRTPITNRPIDQLTGAGCSAAANYLEATEAVSRKDFIYRLKVSRKESKEARFFAEVLLVAIDDNHEGLKWIAQEALELQMIFNKSIETAQKNDRTSKLSKYQI